jgi:hypothetical protein
VHEGGPVIVAATGEETVVFSGRDTQETRRFYELLKERVAKAKD